MRAIKKAVVKTKLEKTYLITNVRLESKEIVSLELLDESSQPPVVKTAVFRLGMDEYKALDTPTVNQKITVNMLSVKNPTI